VFKTFQAPHTLAIKGKAETALREKTAFKLLNFQIVFQRFIYPDHIIPRLDIQFRNRNLALQVNLLNLQMAQIY
jgi:hypothetical protein